MDTVSLLQIPSKSSIQGHSTRHPPKKDRKRKVLRAKALPLNHFSISSLDEGAARKGSEFYDSFNEA
jgi:hypothetical protein